MMYVNCTDVYVCAVNVSEEVCDSPVYAVYVACT